MTASQTRAARMMADVLDEKITAELAEREYGVVLDALSGRMVRREYKPPAADSAR